ncbi:MAG: phospho-N-acetylmuramoyl-pentapeptide-transferase [Clostridiales bacterium]|jgi:phospho-N-acetylmuramoyl-pentapeptide-transferase|nr:phospho-N-acetylmuramoyl-pentapeptide-transferase [Clostridiales bacterium]HOA33965.1 phospho-N-acetylmuramoyl-pentapeptide-transferase [Clostridiales bacterium]HOJ35175.1 phospho-N-acetylmuramoyl-pentapeptide-transferase [Clostridiales bacterium]HOL79414.1 phospho-N-acetylmuramoyl-pentapeptide-transferase [Clostridiales bacterium]HQA04801.1 phospho-N-acetylmuramoyl-pentapeptide-transferase [Clostridiales bacterium]
MNKWFALILSALVGFGTAYALGYVVIPWLHKLKFGQTILDIGPSWHKKKQGTPTMGGILFIAGVIASLIVTVLTYRFMGDDIISGDAVVPNTVKVKIFGGLLMAIAFALVGFADDYIKVKRGRNLGLTIMQKSIAQVIIMGLYLYTLSSVGATYIYIPFVGVRDIGIFYWILGVLAIYCTVNAVNFTDGIDGLCASVTAVACVSFAVIAVLRGMFGVSLISSALFGSLIGYLIWNWHPAKVMMGDVGSLFLGGMVIAISYALDAPWLLLTVGIIYVIEFLSDVIQIVYFRLTGGKRIFKMAPIHHHFEKSGWSEVKIVKVFSLIGALGGLFSILITWFGRIK